MSQCEEYEEAEAAYLALPPNVQRMLTTDYEVLQRQEFGTFRFDLLEAFIESDDEIRKAWEQFCDEQWLEFFQGSEECWQEYLRNAMKPQDVNTPKD